MYVVDRIQSIQEKKTKLNNKGNIASINGFWKLGLGKGKLKSKKFNWTDANKNP